MIFLGAPLHPTPPGGSVFPVRPLPRATNHAVAPLRLRGLGLLNLLDVSNPSPPQSVTHLARLTLLPKILSSACARRYSGPRAVSPLLHPPPVRRNCNNNQSIDFHRHAPARRLCCRLSVAVSPLPRRWVCGRCPASRRATSTHRKRQQRPSTSTHPQPLSTLNRCTHAHTNRPAARSTASPPPAPAPSHLTAAARCHLSSTDARVRPSASMLRKRELPHP
jgi:hypothetical protein